MWGPMWVRGPVLPFPQSFQCVRAEGISAMSRSIHHAARCDMALHWSPISRKSSPSQSHSGIEGIKVENAPAASLEQCRQPLHAVRFRLHGEKIAPRAGSWWEMW